MARKLVLTECVVLRIQIGPVHGSGQIKPVPLLVNGVFGDAVYDRSGFLCHLYILTHLFYIGLWMVTKSDTGSLMKSLYIRKYIRHPGDATNCNLLLLIHVNNAFHMTVCFAVDSHFE